MSADLISLDDMLFDDTTPAPAAAPALAPAPVATPTPIDIMLVTCSNCHAQIRMEDIDIHGTKCFAASKTAAPAPTPAPAPAPASVVATAPVSAFPITGLAAAPAAAPPKEKKKGFFSSLFGGDEQASGAGGGAPGSSSSTPTSGADKMPPQLARDAVKGAFILHVVDQPTKTKLLNGIELITYRISAKSDLPEFAPKPVTQVRRTFYDFQWLHKHLIRLYPSFIVPPLVDRKKLLKDDSSPAFLAARTRHVQRFLNRVAVHPVLAKTELLRLFLWNDEKQMDELRNKLDAQEKAAEAARPKKGWFSGGSAPPPFSQEDAAALEKAKTFKAEAAEMETQFRDMAAIAKTATEKGADSAKALSNFHGTLEKFTKLKSVTSPSSGLASNQLINCITTLMATWTESAKTRSDLANVDSDGLYEILKDWAYYFKAAGEFASRFENLRIQFAGTRTAWENQKKKTGETDPATIQLGKLLAEDQNNLDITVKNIGYEILRFDEAVRLREVLHWTAYYAKIQIQAHQNAIRVWEKYLENFGR